MSVSFHSLAGFPFFMFHERSRERMGCRCYSWTHPCVRASIPPAEGLSTALLNAVLLYPLVTLHQEPPHDSSALHISRNCTIRNTQHVKAYLRPWGQVQATTGPWGRSVCFDIPPQLNGEKGTMGELGWNSGPIIFRSTGSPNSLAS